MSISSARQVHIRFPISIVGCRIGSRWRRRRFGGGGSQECRIRTRRSASLPGGSRSRATQAFPPAIHPYGNATAGIRNSAKARAMPLNGNTCVIIPCARGWLTMPMIGRIKEFSMFWNGMIDDVTFALGGSRSSATGDTLDERGGSRSRATVAFSIELI